jgi:hypothetical protein
MLFRHARTLPLHQDGNVIPFASKREIYPAGTGEIERASE